MSLHEVMKGREPIEAVTFSLIEANKLKSAEIEAQTQEFLAKGGKVTTLSINQAAIDTKEMALLVNEFDGYDIDRSKKIASQKKKFDIDHFGENRAKQRSPYGQNITKTKYGKYIAVVAQQNKTFATPEEAREWRDRQREIHGFPPAEY